MNRTFLGTLALALLVPLAGCDDGTGVDGPGTLSLLLTDAPGDFQEAWVTIERIDMVAEDEEIITLMDEPVTQDLLALANDVESLVDGLTVPAGTYHQLRFIVPEACIVVEGDTEGSTKVFASEGYDACGTPDGELHMPSFAQSGIKVNFMFGGLEVQGSQHVVLLDFDVSESFGREAGNSGRWVMTPVIHASEVEFSGSITVEFTLADSVSLEGLGNGTLADFQAELSTEASPLAFTDPDEDGVFTATFLFLVPLDGRELSVTLNLPDAESYDFTLDPTSPQIVDLGSGESATVAFEVTSATAPSS